MRPTRKSKVRRSRLPEIVCPHLGCGVATWPPGEDEDGKPLGKPIRPVRGLDRLGRRAWLCPACKGRLLAWW